MEEYKSFVNGEYIKGIQTLVTINPSDIHTFLADDDCVKPSTGSACVGEHRHKTNMQSEITRMQSEITRMQSEITHM